MSRVLNMGPIGAGTPANFRPIDSKREEFRKYLERAGVMDALTKVLVLLYEEPEKPDNALEYVRMNLGEKQPLGNNLAAVKNELECAVQKLEALETENAELKAQLAALTHDQIPDPDQPQSDTPPPAN